MNDSESKLTKEQLAQMLDGLEYPVNIPQELVNVARKSGLVIVYGSSDDLMEFEGAETEEVNCYEGGRAYFTPEGLLENRCSDAECPYFEKEIAKAAIVEALWDQDGYSWTYRTAIPHATFDVMEEGQKYCKGIVFALADVKAEGK